MGTKRSPGSSQITLERGQARFSVLIRRTTDNFRLPPRLGGR
jgi:hypothetical protein